MSKVIAGQNAVRLFWRVKIRLAVNYLSHVRRHILLHAAAAFAVILLLLGGGYWLFAHMFRFLAAPEQQPFGLPLMRRLVGIVLLAFFSMLTFSNLIIMLTTTYISREVEHLMSIPFSHRRLFFCKMGESTIYSTWAFSVMSLPFFAALARTATPDAPFMAYPTIGLMIVPYIIIPSALGAIATLVLSAFVPARKTFRLALALGAVTLGIAMVTEGMAGLSGSEDEARRVSIGRAMRFMGMGDVAWMPSTWLRRGIDSCLSGQWTETLFWGSMLAATALMALQICFWLAGPLYYPGFCASRSSGQALRMRSGGIYAFFNRLAAPLRPAPRALVVKDLTVFWRDPAQWVQLVMLLGLVFIYLLNLRYLLDLQAMQVKLTYWKAIFSVLNIGAICFMLSILSTRFFYPMLSLEGKQQWVIGLAPIRRTRLVWVKYGVCGVCSLALTLPLTAISCWVLRTPASIFALSVLTILMMSLGLNSLAIGLGALMPNFSEDNPARIANGLGGTLNVIVSLIYIGSTMALEFPLIGKLTAPTSSLGGYGFVLIEGTMGISLLIHALVIVMPMRWGIRHWKRLEF